MPVDQKIAGRGVFILANTRFQDRSVGERREAFGHESPHFGCGLHHPIASVRIERRAMPVESNFHAAILQVGQYIFAAVAAKVDPNWHFWRPELPISSGRTE